jgi:hypothetical protein
MNIKHLISTAGWSKLDFAERDKCKPGAEFLDVIGKKKSYKVSSLLFTVTSTNGFYNITSIEKNQPESIVFDDFFPIITAISLYFYLTIACGIPELAHSIAVYIFVVFQADLCFESLLKLRYQHWKSFQMRSPKSGFFEKPGGLPNMYRTMSGLIITQGTPA